MAFGADGDRVAEYSPVAIDLPKVLRMLIVHDIVEIDAGDTFAYDKEGNATKKDRERRGAERIYGLLPMEMEKICADCGKNLKLR